ncbi:MAG: hypothetical protein V4506_05755 [Bacteroidota bacterium]
MKYDWINVVLIYLYASAFVSQVIGEKRKIGYRKSAYWCLILTPFIGLIITLLSPKLKNKSLI